MKKAFLSDTAFKIYSVLIAILLWVFVVYNQNPESTKTVSGIGISYTNISELEAANLVVLKGNSSPSVDVSIKGRRLSLGKLDSENISAYATIPEMRPGEYEAAINVQLPINDVSIIDKKPYTLKITVENLKKISVPVEIKYTGNPKNPETSVQASVSPQEISLSGPESVINSVAGAVVSLDVSDVTDGENTVRKYKLLSKDGNDITDNVNISADTDSVSVMPSVYATKEIPIEPRYSGTIPEGYTISAAEALPAQIRLGSKDAAVENIQKIYTAPIDISNLTQSGKVYTKLVIPDGLVNIFSVTDAEVDITVEPSSSKTVSVETVTFENGADSKTYSAAGLPLYVTLTGAQSVLTDASVSASVDVSSLSDGTHTLPLKLNLPDGVHAAAGYSVAVTVTDKNASPGGE